MGAAGLARSLCRRFAGGALVALAGVGASCESGGGATPADTIEVSHADTAAPRPWECTTSIIPIPADDLFHEPVLRALRSTPDPCPNLADGWLETPDGVVVPGESRWEWESLLVWEPTDPLAPDQAYHWVLTAEDGSRVVAAVIVANDIGSRPVEMDALVGRAFEPVKTDPSPHLSGTEDPYWPTMSYWGLMLGWRIQVISFPEPSMIQLRVEIDDETHDLLGDFDPNSGAFAVAAEEVDIFLDLTISGNFSWDGSRVDGIRIGCADATAILWDCHQAEVIHGRGVFDPGLSLPEPGP